MPRDNKEHPFCCIFYKEEPQNLRGKIENNKFQFTLSKPYQVYSPGSDTYRDKQKELKWARVPRKLLFDVNINNEKSALVVYLKDEEAAESARQNGHIELDNIYSVKLYKLCPNLHHCDQLIGSFTKTKNNLTFVEEEKTSKEELKDEPSQEEKRNKPSRKKEPFKSDTHKKKTSRLHVKQQVPEEEIQVRIFSEAVKQQIRERKGNLRAQLKGSKKISEIDKNIKEDKIAALTKLEKAINNKVKNYKKNSSNGILKNVLFGNEKEFGKEDKDKLEAKRIDSYFPSFFKRFTDAVRSTKTGKMLEDLLDNERIFLRDPSIANVLKFIIDNKNKEIENLLENHNGSDYVQKIINKGNELEKQNKSLRLHN